MGKALEYVNKVMKSGSLSLIKTEKEALNFLIKSHKNQREILREDTNMIMYLGQYHHVLAFIHRKIHNFTWKEMGKSNAK